MSGPVGPYSRPAISSRQTRGSGRAAHTQPIPPSAHIHSACVLLISSSPPLFSLLFSALIYPCALSCLSKQSALVFATSVKTAAILPTLLGVPTLFGQCSRRTLHNRPHRPQAGGCEPRDERDDPRPRQVIRPCTHNIMYEPCTKHYLPRSTGRWRRRPI